MRSERKFNHAKGLCFKTRHDITKTTRRPTTEKEEVRGRLEIAAQIKGMTSMYEKDEQSKQKEDTRLHSNQCL